MYWGNKTCYLYTPKRIYIIIQFSFTFFLGFQEVNWFINVRIEYKEHLNSWILIKQLRAEKQQIVWQTSTDTCNHVNIAIICFNFSSRNENGWRIFLSWCRARTTLLFREKYDTELGTSKFDWYTIRTYLVIFWLICFYKKHLKYILR